MINLIKISTKNEKDKTKNLFVIELLLPRLINGALFQNNGFNYQPFSHGHKLLPLPPPHKRTRCIEFVNGLKRPLFLNLLQK